MRPIALFAATFAMAAFVGGCATTTQTTDARPSGFLGDYSQLKPGEEGQAQLVYLNPDADFSKYNKILLEPVAVYAAGEDSNLSKVPKDQLEDIVNYLDAEIREQLKDNYTFVNTPGPATMRMRVAITEAKGANVALSATSTVLPVGAAVSAIKKITTGAGTGVARAGVEMELRDAQTNQRLFAAVDERAGGKISSFQKWQGVKEAYDYWARKMDQRLAELRTTQLAGIGATHKR